VGEHTTPRMILERLPQEREISEMLHNVDYIKRSLEQLRDQVQQNLRQEHLQGKMKGPYEDEDVQMYDTAKPAFGVAEVKKRRGVRAGRKALLPS
jgi:TPP-dependent 2-oxoacid decarboxylase